jgi:hypothetical protein
VKILSEVREPLSDLDKCSLQELIAILKKFSNDPTINVNQAGFGYYIPTMLLKKRFRGIIMRP